MISSRSRCCSSLLYAFHPSEQKIVPSLQCFLIIGSSTFLVRLEGTCTAIASNDSLSVNPKTHFSSSFHPVSPSLRPQLYLGFPGKKLSSNSTIFPHPPIFGMLSGLLIHSVHTVRANLYHLTIEL